MLRCPNCGRRGVFRHWFAMRERCPSCQCDLASGNRVGANLLNLVAAEGVMALILVTVTVRSWPNPPWTLLQFGAPVLMIVLPLLFFPFSKLSFVAIDLAMHPAGMPDRHAHGVDATSSTLPPPSPPPPPPPSRR